MMDWDNIVQRYIDSFVNGNRETVIRDLADWTFAEAIAISARIAVGLPEEARESFLHLTAYYAED